MQLIRKFLQGTVGLLIAVAMLLDGQKDQARAENVGTFVPGQLVVKLNPANLVSIAVINDSYGTVTLKPLLNDPLIYLLQVPVGQDPAILAEQMELDTRLLFAEPNFVGQILEGIGRARWAWGGTSDATMAQQYAASMLKLPQAQALSNGANSVVAVIDTGIQLDHPAYAHSLTASRWDFIDNDGMPDENFAAFDTNADGIPDSLAGHGTHVAEIVHMTAPGAMIMPLRVLDGNGLGDEFKVAEAIQFAAQNGANVINLSLGTSDKSELIQSVLHDVVDNGNIVVVAAAGNASSKEKQWPAASSYAIAVTSVGANGQRSDFANFGSWVDIAAPGDNIFSAFPVNGYATWSGTSMATPFVAGQAALLHSRFPTFNTNQITERIMKSATPLDHDSGAGLLNLVASLQ